MGKVRCENCFSTYDDVLDMCPYCGYSKGDPPSDAFCLFPGTKIHQRYIIGQETSSGGFGVVYKALDLNFGTVVAIKEYFPSGLVNRFLGKEDVILVAGKRAREFNYGKKRFIEEAQNIAKFNGNSNIVNVFDYFEENNTAYIVMEYLDGNTLSEYIQKRQGALPFAFCLRIAIDICSALSTIHKEKIIHRDVSPDNIMVCKNGNIKLFDFGAARFSAEVASTVTIIVKPGFAPPEQYEQVNRQDARTDIYALGATLYYAITGIKPEESTDRKMKDTLVAPETLNKQIPHNVSVAIMRAMAIEPQYRFTNAGEFAKALKNEIQIISIRKMRRIKRRKRIVGIICSFIVLSVAAGIFTWLYNAEREKGGLPDADINILYCSSGDENTDAIKQQSFDAIAENFMNEYTNVKIKFYSVSEDALQSELAHSENMPALYESTTLSDEELNTGNLVDLSALEIDSDMYLNADHNIRQLPLGLNVPVIYFNTSIGTAEEVPSIKTLQELCADASSELVVSEDAAEMYETLYAENVSTYVHDHAKETFLEGNAMAFLGTSSDYLDVQSKLPGIYSIIIPNTGFSCYTYTSLWSIQKTDDDVQTVAEAFLNYMTSDLAQDYLYIQAQNAGIPVTGSAVYNYLNIYSELKDIAGFLELPFAD